MYLPEWFGYASNLTSIRAFVREGRWGWVLGTTLSTLYYCAFVGSCWYIHPTFTLFTLVYAFLEGNILLSIVNFVWPVENPPPLATKNLLEVTDGLRRPPSTKGGATQSISDLSMR